MEKTTPETVVPGSRDSGSMELWHNWSPCCSHFFLFWTINTQKGPGTQWAVHGSGVTGPQLWFHAALLMPCHPMNFMD